jgi:HEPN domain-containing protein
MSGKRKKPDDPREWLNRARSNLVRSRLALPGIYLEDLCFDAQQAAEKAIKAVLICRNIRYPYVHDLGKLLSLAERRNIKVPVSVRKAARLTRFAVASRYPGFDEPVGSKEQKEAVTIAENVIRWAERIVSRDQSQLKSPRIFNPK